jgi:hypothetical protein
LRDAYAALKRELAQRHGSERSRYTAAKSAFIEHVLADTAKHRGQLAHAAIGDSLPRNVG